MISLPNGGCRTSRNLVHDFDTSSLKELEKALQKRLLPVLDEIAADRDKSLSE
jgi:hypothetical protein